MNSKFLKIGLTAVFAIPLGILSSESLFAIGTNERLEQNQSEEYLLSCGGGGGGSGTNTIEGRQKKKEKQKRAKALFKLRKGLPLTDEEKVLLDK